MTIAKALQGYDENRVLIERKAAEGEQYAKRLIGLMENHGHHTEAAFNNFFLSAYVDWSAYGDKEMKED
jgi:hypothetical protein